MSTASNTKIAIVGAGPAGLLLGNILQRNSVPFQIFEASESARTSGGSLDIHPNDGQAALREAGLWEGFAAHARPEADVMKVVNPAGEVLWDGNTVDKHEVKEDEKFDHRPEIDRGDLLKVLLSRLQPSDIQWGRKLNHVETIPAADSKTTAKYDLVFADGSSEKGFDLVVGADGAWSKVRKVLTDAMPGYAGVSGMSFSLPNVAQANPWADKMVGAGSVFSFGEGVSVMSQQQGDGSIWSYGWVQVPEGWASEMVPHHGHDEKTGADKISQLREARDRMIDAYFADYAPDMVRLLRESEPDPSGVRPLYHLPVGFSWDHPAGTEGVTLLGDAAHVMTPFAGVGVNAALADAHQLAKGILSYVGKRDGDGESFGSCADVVAVYERDMFPRAKKFATQTAHGLKYHFLADGSEEFVGRLTAQAGHWGDEK